MVTRVITSDADQRGLFTLLAAQKQPYTVNVTKGADRSIQQNRLAFTLYREIAEQLNDRTAEDVRAECKLCIGVPILRADSEEYCKVYDKYIKGRPPKEKLALMVEPMDLAVTRAMTTSQMKRYLDEIYRRYSEQGCVLTHPETEKH